MGRIPAPPPGFCPSRRDMSIEDLWAEYLATAPPELSKRATVEAAEQALELSEDRHARRIERKG